MTLVGYWPLNESSGTTAYDNSGNENHGIVKDGGDSTIPGATGILGQKAYSFDGNNDYIDYGNVLSLPDTGFAISAWVNINSFDTHNAIFFKNDSWQFVAHQDNRLWLGTFGTGHTTSTSIPKGVWVHLAVSYPQSGKVYGWINGVRNSMGTSDNNVGSTSNSLYAGYRSYGEDYFDGKISELRIYNRTLTSSEVQYLRTVGERGLHTTSKKTS